MTKDTLGGYDENIKNKKLKVNKIMEAEIKKKIIKRLKILEGQVRGLQRMVAEEKYCLDILRQCAAIKEALSGCEALMLKNHLTTHVLQQIKSGQKNKAIQDILSIYKFSSKNKIKGR